MCSSKLIEKFSVREIMMPIIPDINIFRDRCRIRKIIYLRLKRRHENTIF
jgi:hypothetical protein